MLRKFNRQRNRDARDALSCDNRTRLTAENTGGGDSAELGGGPRALVADQFRRFRRAKTAVRPPLRAISKGTFSRTSYAGRGDGFRVYGATKAAVNSLCITLRNELEDEPIRVVNVMPGAVATNFGRNHAPDFVNGLLKSFALPATFQTGDVLPDSTLEALSARASAIFASPDDIARSVLYAVTQPHDVNISEILVGPRKAFPQPHA